MVRSFVLCLALLALVRPATAQLSVLETEDMRLVYLDPLHRFITSHVARCFENSMDFQREIFDYTPTEKVTVILGDFADVGNAGAGAVPRNGMAVMMAPPSMAYETNPGNERMNTLMNHELVHVACFDRASGRDGFFRGLFRGKVRAESDHPETILYNYLTAPRASAPRWFHEGIAVFLETWMAGGVGRAQGTFDEMIFRAMVADGTPFYDRLGLVSEGTSTDFQLEASSYLYGARFMSFLARSYSPQHVIDWVSRTPGSKAHYTAQFRKVFGRSIDDVWKDWVAEETAFQEQNLARLREYPVTPFEDLTDRALGSVSRAHVDEETDRLYVAVNYPGTLSYVGAIDMQTGEIDRLVDVKGPTLYTVTSLAWDPGRRKLYYTTDNGDWRDVVELDPDSGDTRRLVQDARMGDLVVDPRDGTIWGIRNYNGYSTIARIVAPYDQWDQVATFDYGDFAFHLDTSPDGEQLVASVRDPDGTAEVRVWNTDELAETLDEPVHRFDFGMALPLNFVFTPDGRAVIGSTYLTGVSNLFRYSLERGEWEALTNTETGLFRPIARGDEDVIAFRFSGKGFVPSRLRVTPLEDLNAIELYGARVVAEQPVLEEWNVGSPGEVDLDSRVTYRGPYRPLRSLELESIVPIVEGYKNQTAYGLRADVSDPLSLHEFRAAASYTPNPNLPDDERLHLDVGYAYSSWSLGYRLNDASFYDLFGPTKRSRKGYAIDLGWQRSLIDDAPRTLDLGVHVTRWAGLEVLPEYQNVASSFDETVSGSIDLDWKDRKFSIGSVDYQKGVEASLSFGGNYVNETLFPDVVATFDVGVPLPIPYTSIWLRTAGGSALETPLGRDEPFSNFYLGGFGNNWIDRGAVKRYRAWYAFPGFELNEIGGTNFVKALVDLNLPPLRFRRAGVPSLHATWIRASLFGGGLVTDVDLGGDRTEVATAGAQLDMRIKLMSNLRFTLSAGYAFGYADDRWVSNEFMLSLKIL